MRWCDTLLELATCLWYTTVLRKVRLRYRVFSALGRVRYPYTALHPLFLVLQRDHLRSAASSVTVLSPDRYTTLTVVFFSTLLMATSMRSAGCLHQRIIRKPCAVHRQIARIQQGFQQHPGAGGIPHMESGSYRCPYRLPKSCTVICGTPFFAHEPHACCRPSRV